MVVDAERGARGKKKKTNQLATLACHSAWCKRSWTESKNCQKTKALAWRKRGSQPPVTLASTRRHVGSSCSEWRMPSHPLRLLSRLSQHGLVQLAPVWKSTRYLAKSTGVSRLLSKDESRCPNETKTLPTRHEAPSVANLQGT